MHQGSKKHRSFVAMPFAAGDVKRQLDASRGEREL